MNDSLKFIPVTRWRVSGLKTALSKHRCTQKKLAKKMGLSPQFICDVVHGRRTVSETQKNYLEEGLR